MSADAFEVAGLADGLQVRSTANVDPVRLHGAVQVRKMFSKDDTAFKSGCSFVLYNRISAGEENQRHHHDDVEKVHYVVQGSAVVECGDASRRVAVGDFFFFPVGVPHNIRNDGAEHFEYVVVAMRADR